MTLNIPVPIPQLQRTGDLSNQSLFVIEQNNVTHNVNWSRLLSVLVNIPDSIIFGYGSVELPAVSLGDSFSGFYAPQLGSVAVSTGHTRKLFVGPSGLIEFGDVDKKDTTVTTIKSESFIKCNASLLGDANIEKNLVVNSDLTINGSISIEDITINGDSDDLILLGGYIKFGEDCNQSLNSFNTSRFYCGVTANEDITVVRNLNNHPSTFDTTITTQDLVVAGDSTLTTLTSSESILVDDGATVELGKDGNLTISGDLTVDKIFGDGSGLTNLNIPDVLRSKGSIDPTTQGPGTPQHGDVWYSTADGNFTNDWVGVEGQPIKISQSFYYFETPTPTWVVGAISDLPSAFFMFVDLEQTVTGEKTHESRIFADNTIDAGSSDITANILTLTSKATSALTVSGNPGNTLTTKSYTDARMENTIYGSRLSTSKYIIGQSYDGSAARIWNLDASSVGTDNLVLRDGSGNFSANQITATLLDGTATDATTLDVKHSSSDSDHPITLVTGTGTSRNVYCDNDFTYNPVTNTLTVDNIVSNVTGNIDGNVDTITSLETPRTLWGQSFDGTSDVSGDLVDVGDATPFGNDLHDLGSVDNVWANVYATTFHGDLAGDVEIANSTEHTLSNGDHVLGGDWNGSTGITWSVDCDSSTTPSKIVVRDNDGSFSSNVITANGFVGPLTGDVTGDASGSSSSVTGNAATATALETSRTLWSQSFDGTSDVSGHLELTGNVVPAQASTYEIGSAALPYKTLYVDTIDFDIDNNSSSTDKLNNPLGRGDYLLGSFVEWDGSASDTWNLDPATENTPNKIVLRDSNGDFESEVITADRFVGPLTGNVTGDASGSSSSVTGNAATTSKLQTTTTLWGQGFDGTQNVSGTIIDTGNVLPEVDATSDIGRVDKRFKNIYAETFYGRIMTNVDSTDFLSSTLSSGNYIIGDGWDGSSDVYWNVFGHSDNVNNSVVLRDASGDFEASTITSNLAGPVVGNVTGDASGSSSSVTGNAATTTKLENQSEVTVTLTGVYEGSGSFQFDGTADVVAEIETTLTGVGISNLDPLPE